jgi:hypothetical protein
MPKTSLFPTLALATLLSPAASADAQLPPHLVPYRQVTWADFQDSTVPLGPEVAKIAIVMHIEPFDIEVEHRGGDSWVARARDPQVVSYMDPSQSGVRPAGNTDYVLAHEQLHFDIAELYARRIRKALGEAELEGDDPVRVRFAFENRLREIRTELLTELDATQERYDRESGHGKAKRMQKSWNKKIEAELGKVGS